MTDDINQNQLVPPKSMPFIVVKVGDLLTNLSARLAFPS